tara:strand:- start:157 stop:684 length:528 start_codon:yes stop_codon:yes gene_type:complete
MTALSASSDSSPELFKRLRRLGWIMIGNSAVVNLALAEVIDDLRARLINGDLDHNVEVELFARSVQVFDETEKGQRSVRILQSATGHLPDLARQLKKLTANERIALGLLEIEDFSVEDASQISSRPRSVLRHAIETATDKLNLRKDLQVPLDVADFSDVPPDILRSPRNINGSEA